MKKIELPKELTDKILQLVGEAKASGKIKKGTNEATKSVERSEAKFVVIAADTNPIEIVMHIPMLCEERGIPFAFVATKAELGSAAGLPVGTSAIAIANAGEGAKKLHSIVEQINIIIKGENPAPAEVKSEAKHEAPKAEVKHEAKKEEKPAEAKPKKAKKEKPAEVKAE